MLPHPQCQYCPKGQYQGQNISAHACNACNFGRYSDDTGSQQCKTCTGPEKENITWKWLKGSLDGNQCQTPNDICTASCAFSCFSSYTRLDGGCKDLVQAIVGMFGGPVAFCAVVTLVLAGLFLTWNRLCQKPAQSTFVNGVKQDGAACTAKAAAKSLVTQPHCSTKTSAQLPVRTPCNYVTETCLATCVGCILW